MTWRDMVGANVFALGGPNRGAMVGVWWNVALLVLSLAAMPFDKRLILGLNPWVKPVKFEISVIVFLLTMAALLSGLGRLGAWPALRVWMSWGFGVAMIVENTVIAMQSLRGVRSHMNTTTLFNGLSFGLMGVFIVISTALLAVLLVLYLRTPTGLPTAVVWGTGLGLAAMLAGSVEGGMIIVKVGAHTVGAADGGPGLWFVNWSTGHGDLRVAHFLALHALQIFVLAGWGLSRTRWPEWAQTASVVGFAVAYGVVTWMLFAQALAGRPVLRV